MKLVSHLAVLLFSFLAFTSRSNGQENDKSMRGIALSITATAVPASNIVLSINPNNTQVSVINSTTAGLVRLKLLDANASDVVEQTSEGTLFLNRVEIFVRFSGYRKETAAILITVSSIDDATSGQALREGSSPEASKTILANETIKVPGVKSGQKIVRYFGFLVPRLGRAVPEKSSLGAEVRYEITHPE
jgi:hypothetical protein